MRPKIICHMVSSIDGRLHPSRFTVPAAGVDGDRLRRHYDEVAARFGAQGWMVGRKTMQEIAKGAARTPAGAGVSSREPFVGNRKGRDLAVAIDPHGRVHYGQDHVLGDHVVAVLSEAVSDAYLAELREDGVSYLFAGPDGTDLRRAMDALGQTFGVETILLQGGASINGAFLKQRLIDEISLLIQPAIDGLAGVPSIFGYEGSADERPGAGQALRHLHTETLEGGMVWLRYRVEDAPALG
ncbi:RibD family protein [Methylobacterium nodulans]|uniref:Putative 5-amino-6-(5-phosphoribosylamino)uracil reductase n=1 Tax=Methylobacterium nodulans (strain LMG 21967 / CNCM I-2342 / ORS 2060) TaxID=460265 RepID=B8IVN7_METNO|nr:RibD family protein [Methylobacterium nodulans]ACL62477.1 putative 5-amino-6-(5-phosphoribosylamino)uracil reductase [Methylobacterium nodulans ORS 2060]